MGKCVLVVEDDAAIREMLKLALELEGYRVTTAGDGAEALASLAQSAPDVILLDLMMPVMDGWAFAAAVEQDPAYARIPIVVVSAFHVAHKPIKAQRFLQKPVDLDDLMSAVAQYGDATP